MLRGTAIGVLLAAMAAPVLAQDASGFNQDYLGELAYAEHHLTALADAMPTDKYVWRPGEGVRSVSEVYVHVALGNFLLLDIAGHPAPEDLFGKLPAPGRERFMALVARNQELENSVTEKARVQELLKRSLDAVRAAIEGTSPADLEKTADFFGHQKTVRAVYLRMLVHMHEHMGQSVAYARVNGVVPPWSRPAPKQ